MVGIMIACMCVYAVCGVLCAGAWSSRTTLEPGEQAFVGTFWPVFMLSLLIVKCFLLAVKVMAPIYYLGCRIATPETDLPRARVVKEFDQ